MYNSLFWSISPQDAVTQGGFLVDVSRRRYPLNTNWHLNLLWKYPTIPENTSLDGTSAGAASSGGAHVAKRTRDYVVGLRFSMRLGGARHL